MRKKTFLGGCLPLLAAASLLWTGCPDVNKPDAAKPGGLQPPQGLILTAGSASISASWQAVAAAAVYEVRYGIGRVDDFKKEVKAPALSVSLTGLTNDQEYQAHVRAGDGKGAWSEWSETKSATPTAAALGIPEIDVTLGDQQVTVTWESIPGANGYKIRYEKNAPPATGDGEDAASPQQITGLENETKYYFQVRAVDNASTPPRTGGWSGAVEATPSASPPPPQKPYDMRFNNSTEGQLLVQWSAASGATSYEIKWSKTDAESSAGAPATSTERKYTITGLDNGTTYFVWVRAKNNAGASEWLKDSGRTKDPLVTPTGLSAVPADSRVNLQWNKADKAAKYEIQWGIGDAFDQVKPIDNGSTTGYQFTGLTNGTQYKFKVRAGSGSSWSAYSAPAAATPAAATAAPGKVTNLTAAHPGAVKQLTVNWTVPLGATHFNVKYSVQNNEGAAAPVMVNGSDSIAIPPVNITGLDDAKTYYVWVRAVNAIGPSDWETAGGATKTPVTPAVPTGLTVTPSAYRTLVVDWDDTPNADKYRVEYGIGDAFNEAVELPGDEFPQLQSTITLWELDHNARYKVRVKAGADYYSAPCAPVSATTILPAPENVTLSTENKRKQIKVTWETVNGAENYQIRYSNTLTDPNTASRYQHGSSISPGAVIPNLNDNTDYRVWVRAIVGNANTPAAASEWVEKTIRTRQPQFPADVTGLTATAGAGQVSLTWNASSGAAKYTVNYGVGTAFDQQQVSTAAGAVITGLTNYTEYQFRVQAENADGPNPGSYCAAVAATPVLPAPTAPSGVTAAPGAAGSSLLVRWTAATHATGYNVKYHTANNEAAATAYGGTIAATSVTIYGLTGDTTYYVWVYAVNPTAVSGSAGTASGKSNGGAPPIVAGAPTQEPSLGGWAAYEVIDSYVPTWFTEDYNTKNTNRDAKLRGIAMIQWRPVPGATAYDVYVSDTGTRPAAATAETTYCSWFEKGVTGGATKYFWVRAKNNFGPGPVNAAAYQLTLNSSNGVQSGGSFSGLIERADYPKNLNTVAGNNRIYLSWDKSDRAAWYEVYYSTQDIIINTAGGLIGENTNENVKRLVPYGRIDEINNAAIPWDEHNQTAKAVGTHVKVYACESTISNLAPGTYYVWVRSLNHNGERGMAKAGPITVGKLPAAPGLTLSNPAGIGAAFTADWTAVSGATGYNLYYSKYATYDASALKVSMSGSTRGKTVNFLDENTLYYVWVTAVVGGLESPKGNPLSIVTLHKTGNEPVNIIKTTSRGTQVRNHLYVEVNHTDPRIAMGYVLNTADQQPFFDNVVIFAANLRLRNCAAETGAAGAHGCTKRGPHLHFNENVRHILNNTNKYIKPLQDRGIKVLLGLLNDHDDFAYHSMGRWIFEADKPWAQCAGLIGKYQGFGLNATTANYPLGEDIRAEFCEELAQAIEQYGLDGFDIDDEWESDSYTPGNSVFTSVYSGCNEEVAKIYAEFLYLMRKRLPTKIISVYAWHATHLLNIGNAATLELQPSTYTAATGPAAGKDYTIPAGKKVSQVWTDGWADYATHASWNNTNWSPECGADKARYAPLAYKMQPPAYPSTANCTQFVSQDYGYTTWYDLCGHTEGSPKASVESVLSTVSQTLFGCNVIYNGPNYPKDW